MVFGLWHHPQFMQAVQNHIDSRASTEEGNGQLGHIEQGRIEHRQLPCLVKDSEPDREVGKGFAKRLDKAASVLICAHKRRRIICKMNKIAIVVTSNPCFLSHATATRCYFCTCPFMSAFRPKKGASRPLFSKF
jgi:hypothetical protein